jgi:hypothetical protein
LHEFCLMYRLEVDEEKEGADGIRIDMVGL